MLSNGLYRVTITQSLGPEVKSGFSFNVAAASTGGPSIDDMMRAFYIATEIPYEGSNRNQYYGKLSAGNSYLKFDKIADTNSEDYKDQSDEQWRVHKEGVFTSGGKKNKDEEEAKEKRKEKKEKADDKGCCGAWYCCPFRCSWKLLCSFFG